MADSSLDKTASHAAPRFQLGDWTVDPDACRIQRTGQEARLEPLVMTVLTILAARPGKVISREELEAQAWTGKVVGYDALASCIIKLRKALGDDTHHPRYIETVSKKGYRLIAEVSYPSAATGPDTPLATPPKRRRSLLNIGLLLLLILMMAAGTWIDTSSQDKSTTSPVSHEQTVKRTIMVLPFTRIGGDPKEEYFVEGITDDLITDLSDLSGIVVVSNTATYHANGEQFDPRKIAEKMSVDFLLQGSVRKSGKRWRINAKLINVYNGANLWAERFENTKTNIFAAQDEIRQGIVDSLAVQLNAQDRKRIKHRATTNFEAYDLFLQGQKLFKQRSRNANETAQDNYRRAIELDPNFSRAYSALAVSLVVHYWRGWTETPSETLDRALKMATMATQLDPSSPQAYWALGYAHMYLKHPDKAAKAVEKTLKLAPNYADGYGLLALINNQRGNGTKAEQLIRHGMKLNPYYSWDYPYILGRAYYTMEKFTEAINPLREALNRNEDAVNPRLFLAAAYVALGRKDDAQWEIEQIRVMSPDTTISQLQRDYPISDEILFHRFLQHLREAGLPDN